MKSPVHIDHKEFLLGEHAAEYEAVFSAAAYKTPKKWSDYYLAENTVLDLGEVDELYIIEKYLHRSKQKLRSCWCKDELPSEIVRSLQTLLKAENRYEPSLAWNNREFKQFYENSYLPNLHEPDFCAPRDNCTLRASNAHHYIRQKFLALEKILNAGYGVKLFFLIEKRPKPPYQIDSVGLIYFFIRPVETRFAAETEDYLVRDIAFFGDDERDWRRLVTQDCRCEAARSLGQIASAIKRGTFNPPPNQYTLADGMIALFDSLYPQFPRIDFGNEEWNQCQVVIVEESEGKLHERDRVAYAEHLASHYLANTPFNNTAHMCSDAEKEQYGIHLILKYREDAQAVLEQADIEKILEEHRQGGMIL